MESDNIKNDPLGQKEQQQEAEAKVRPPYGKIYRFGNLLIIQIIFIFGLAMLIKPLAIILQTLVLSTMLTEDCFQEKEKLLHTC